jgi:hypothetical protein
MIIGAVAVCLAMAKPPGKGRPVKITRNCIQIPGTEISQSDQEKVSEIFKKYDKWPRIYRIQPYGKGNPTRPIGEMKIDNKTAKEVANYATSTGLTSWTTQIGLCKDVGQKCSSGGPQCLERSLQLVEEITPILKKYQ